VDYLLKPIRRERLKAALDKAVRLTRAQLGGLGGKQARARTHISATLHRKLHLVPVDEIRFFQADQKYVSVGYRDGLVLIEEPLKALEAEFQDRFMRVHRNALVAVRYVESLEREARDRYAVRLTDVAEPLEVSRRLLTAVKRRLKGP